MKVLLSTQSAKFWVAAAAAIIITGLTAYEGTMEGGMTPQEWVTVALAVVGAIGVWVTKNAPTE